jgi:hypothetical protein
MSSSEHQTQVIEAACLHQADDYRRLRSGTGEDPVLILITVAFNSSCASDELSRPKVASLFRYWDRLYRHLCSEALGAKFNKPHKRSLQPLTYAFLDLPGTKRRQWVCKAGEHGGTEPTPFRRLMEARNRRFLELVQASPEHRLHLHAVALVNPSVKEGFRAAVTRPSLEQIKRDFGGALQSIDAREIPLADLKRVIKYGAKLLEQAPHGLPPEELWSIMPRSLAERCTKPLATAASSRS